MTTTTVFDVRKKHWLVPFVRESLAQFDVEQARGAIAKHDGDVDAWLEEALQRHGLVTPTGALAGWTTAVPADLPAKRLPEWLFGETLRRQLLLLCELRLLLGCEPGGLDDALQVLMVLAVHAGEADAADQLFELTLEDWGLPGDPRRDGLARAMGGAVKAVGARLVAGALHELDQPLLGLSFHQFLGYLDARQLVAIAQTVFAEGQCRRVDHVALEPVLAHTRLDKIHLIEAVFALMHADGEVTRVERRLVENVVALARLTAEEAMLVWAGFEEPVSVAQLASRIVDRQGRRYAFSTVLVHALFDGSIDGAEEAFIDDLSAAFGLDPGERLAMESAILSHFEENPQLVRAFSMTGVVRRVQARLSHRIERVVRLNLDRLTTEIRETGDLARLLVKRTRGGLSPDEERRVREQITDICKTVPALALFAVPGGSILLPVIMKLLPFDLMPSAFSEKEETL